MKRIIKKEIVNVQPNTQLLHPLSSQWINMTNEDKPICLTKFQIQNKETKIFNYDTCTLKENNYKNYLYLPPIGLSSNDILEIYNISSIDKLLDYIKENMNDDNYLSINRLLNSWIRVNFETLKNYNNFLEKICIKIVTKYYNYNIENIIKKNKDFDLNKEIKKFIDYWINKHNSNEFKLELIDDFIDYLLKKY
jgi:hypothetical protein